MIDGAQASQELPFKNYVQEGSISDTKLNSTHAFGYKDTDLKMFESSDLGSKDQMMHSKKTDEEVLTLPPLRPLIAEMKKAKYRQWRGLPEDR